jgi:hypothetical protein
VVSNAERCRIATLHRWQACGGASLKETLDAGFTEGSRLWLAMVARLKGEFRGCERWVYKGACKLGNDAR